MDDPRLAAIYDHDNPDGPDHDFFRDAVARSGARDVVDLGCGTGILTVTLAAPGRRVVGVDPSAAMLEVARSREGGQNVEWRHGTSELLRDGEADVVLMSGNVAMHIIGDAWHAALTDIAGALRPGGHLWFETRNPAAREWVRWNDAGSERDTAIGRLRESVTTDPPGSDGVVVMHCHTEFDDGDVLEVEQGLQFRSREQVTSDLAEAGLVVRDVWCDWDRTLATGSAAERIMVFDIVKRGHHA